MTPGCKGIYVVSILNREKKKVIAINLPQCSGVKHDILPDNNWICLFDKNFIEIYEKIKENFGTVK